MNENENVNEIREKKIDEKKEFTTIRIQKKLVDALRSYQLPRESLSETVERVLKNMKLLE